MLASTLVPAMIVVAFIYFLLIKKLCWRWLSYGLVLASAALFLSNNTVHAQYTGVQVAGLGWLITWLDPSGYWTKKPWFRRERDRIVGDEARSSNNRGADV
jgi:hypothetical protein